MNKRIKLKKGLLHKKCDESCPNYRSIITFRLITNNGCCCKLREIAHKKLCEKFYLDKYKVYQVDDYYKVVAESKEQTKQFYLSEMDGEEDSFDCREIDPTRYKMYFPINLLPKVYHKEPFRNFDGLCTEIPLSVAMYYRAEKPPYILSVSSDLY